MGNPLELGNHLASVDSRLLFPQPNFAPCGYWDIAPLSVASLSLVGKAFYVLGTYGAIAIWGLGVLFFSLKSFRPLPADWFRVSLTFKSILWGLGEVPDRPVDRPRGPGVRRWDASRLQCTRARPPGRSDLPRGSSQRTDSLGGCCAHLIRILVGGDLRLRVPGQHAHHGRRRPCHRIRLQNT